MTTLSVDYSITSEMIILSVIASSLRKKKRKEVSHTATKLDDDNFANVFGE